MSIGKKRKVSRKGLITKLDTIFSKYIRLYYYNTEAGYVECVTCKTKKLSIKDIHNGHFMSRRYYPTRWEEDNCRPQCASCNTYNQGRQYLFSLHLGAELAYEVYKKSRIRKAYTNEELEALVDYYKQALDLLVTVKFKGIIP